MLLPAATAGLAAGIFIAEAVSPLKLTAAMFYVLVLFLSARFCNARGIVLVGAGCVALTMLAFFLPGFTGTEAGDVGFKASISGAVVGLMTFLPPHRDLLDIDEAIREGLKGLVELLRLESWTSVPHPPRNKSFASSVPDAIVS